MASIAHRSPPARTVVLSTIKGLRGALYKKGFDVSAMTWVDPISPSASDEEVLAKSEVVIGEPGTSAPLLDKMKNLKWFQSTWAGCNPLLDHGKRDYVATRLSGVFGSDMGEYVAMHILTRERAFITERNHQSSKEWHGAAEKIGLGPDGQIRRLHELTLGVLGLGDIGSGIARIMKQGFNMRVLGLRARPCPSEVAEKVYGIGDLSTFLSECDYVVSVLPSQPATRGLLGGEVLKAMQQKQGVLINVGRGDILPEADALNALDSGWIAHLVADVFEKEPLPVSSKLWSHPKVTISPHVSAVTQPSDVATGFAANAELYEKNGVEGLQHIFDFERAY